MGILAAAPVIQAAAPIAQAGLSVAGGLFSNRTNKKIARETNALNYKMFQEANEYNTNMWNMANEYNLPKNQVQRLIDAGINPAAAVDAPQLGAASSPMQSASAPTMQGYTYQNPLANIGSDLVAITQAMKNTKEAQLTDMQTQNYEMDLMSQIDLRKSQGLLSESQANWYKQEFDLKKANWDELLREAVLQNQMKEEEARQLRIANDLMETYGKAIKQEELKKLAAEVVTELERGKTEKAHQILMGIQGDQEKARTIIQRDAQRSQAAVNQQTIAESRERQKLIGSQITEQEFTNRMNDLFGQNERSAELKRKIAEGDIKTAEAFFKELEKGFYDGSRGKYVKGTSEFTKWVGEQISNLLPILKSLK